MCSACLPKNTRLEAKKVSVKPKCLWCSRRDEDEVHFLIEREFTRLVWVVAGLSNLIHVMPGDNVFQILLKLMSARGNKVC